MTILQRKNNAKGITLITLVVTIVIIIILAGITISSLIGENSLLGKTENIAKASNEEEQNIIASMNNMSAGMKEWLGDTQTEYMPIEPDVQTLPVINRLDATVIDKTIIVKVDVIEPECGIAEIKYSKDNGATWQIDSQDVTATQYTYSNVTESECIIKVSVTDNNGNTVYATTTVTINQEVYYYVVDETIYCKTWQEAIDASNNGSTIKLLADVEDNSEPTIDKNITFDTNGKTVSISNPITVNSDSQLIIIGSGRIERNNSGACIINNGTLEINEATIYASAPVSLSGTINNMGNLTMNSGTTIGEILAHGDIIINGGNIENLHINFTSTISINAGTVEEIYVGSDDEISLTIGDINKPVSTTAPCIKKLVFEPLVYTYLKVNFYNGVIMDMDLEDFVSDQGINVRTGYSMKNVCNSDTGAYEWILVAN